MSPEERLLLEVEADEVAARARAEFVRNRLRRKATTVRQASIAEPTPAELVAVDESGKPLGFQSIQGRIHLASPAEIERARDEHPTALILFDLLRDGDEDLRGLPLAARRLRLQERIKPTARERRWIRLSEIAADDGRPMLERAKAEGWEGLIAKDGQSVYHSGRRSPAWTTSSGTATPSARVSAWKRIKVKSQTREVYSHL